MARETLGPRVVILGHHYQQDEVIDLILNMEKVDDMARLPRALQAR